MGGGDRKGGGRERERGTVCLYMQACMVMLRFLKVLTFYFEKVIFVMNCPWGNFIYKAFNMWLTKEIVSHISFGT